MEFKINKNLFNIDGDYYITDPLHNSCVGKYHIILDKDNKVKLFLLSEHETKPVNLINRGVVIASSKFLVNTPYLPIDNLMVYKVKSIEVETTGLGRMGERAYKLNIYDSKHHEFGEVKIINKIK